MAAPSWPLRCWLACAVLALSSRSSLLADNLPASLQPANADLQAGRADAAIAKLTAILKSDPNSAPANNLLCRVEITLQRFDPAADHCQKAVSADPSNARYHLWLGRALGERASRASWTSAFSLAKKTRAEFEQAVQLDPHDAEALSDLGEFYKEAPGIIGGGEDKAEDIARKLDSVDSARSHELQAALAEKQKNLSKAEVELKAALKASSHPALEWMALASFYRRHDRWDEMEAAVRSGQAAAAKDKHAAVALVNGASALVRANRDSDLAVKLFESYLASPDKTEEEPAFDVDVKLARLRKRMGNAPAAEQAKAAALALAHDYKPAIDAFKDEKGN